ncbi:MAG: response regulator transcription factor [Actinobacteria bacterium]|nr:response regulator transcription factor [Actinomycetota bacterium]MBU4403751.1 response regulator transcription factor [Actinomycetota bacterium]MCG2819322.1 response regulator transcription factor [Actinomycetes bacterium]
MEKGQRGERKGKARPKGVLIGPCRLAQDSLGYYLEAEGVVDVINVIVDTEDVTSILDAVGKESPDVILLDEEIIARNSSKLIREIVDKHGEVPLIILAGHSHPNYIYEAIEAGARAYVEKSAVSTQELASVISEVLENNGSAFHITMDRATLSNLSSREHRKTNKVLTDKELKILQYIASGNSNKEIAKKAFISEQTVKVHIHNIFIKVGARDRAQAVAIGFQKKLLL